MTASIKPYTFTNPMPGHLPTQGRVHTGGRGSRGLSYGTTLTCECGWAPNYQATTKVTDGVASRRVITDSKVSNEAPSKGGKHEARLAYLRHVNRVQAKLEAGWKAMAPSALEPGMWATRYDRDEPEQIVAVDKERVATTWGSGYYTVTVLTSTGVLEKHEYQRDNQPCWWVAEVMPLLVQEEVGTLEDDLVGKEDDHPSRDVEPVIEHKTAPGWYPTEEDLVKLDADLRRSMSSGRREVLDLNTEGAFIKEPGAPTVMSEGKTTTIPAGSGWLPDFYLAVQEAIEAKRSMLQPGMRVWVDPKQDRRGSFEGTIESIDGDRLTLVDTSEPVDAGADFMLDEVIPIRCTYAEPSAGRCTLPEGHGEPHLPEGSVKLRESLGHYPQDNTDSAVRQILAQRDATRDALMLDTEVTFDPEWRKRLGIRSMPIRALSLSAPNVDVPMHNLGGEVSFPSTPIRYVVDLVCPVTSDHPDCSWVLAGVRAEEAQAKSDAHALDEHGIDLNERRRARSLALGYVLHHPTPGRISFADLSKSVEAADAADRSFGIAERAARLTAFGAIAVLEELRSQLPVGHRELPGIIRSIEVLRVDASSKVEEHEPAIVLGTPGCQYPGCGRSVRCINLGSGPTWVHIGRERDEQ